MLVKRGLVESRALAQRLVLAGEVRVEGQVVDKPGRMVPLDASLALAARPRFVSRGGEKLDVALSRFGLDVRGWVVADVGASTGGFTDCLLQRGARLVYAIDVGYGQFDWRLRNDERVVLMERTNARYVDQLPQPIDLVTVDVSFISLRLILPQVTRWLRPEGHAVALVKPQFEAGRREVARGGVVRDAQVHRAVLERVDRVAGELGFGLHGMVVSPLRGPSGNVEFLGWWRLGIEGLEAEPAIVACLAEAEG